MSVDSSRNAKSIVSYSDYTEYLSSVLKHHPVVKKPLSISAWARRLKLKSPRSIGMVISGDRSPSMRLMEIIASDLNWDLQEKRYFELQVFAKNNVFDAKLKSQIQQEIEFIKKQKTSVLPMSKLYQEYLSTWYMLPLKQLLSNSDNSQDPKRLAAKLRNKVSVGEVVRAKELLVEMGLFELESSGTMKIKVDACLQTPADIPSTAVRNHHRAMLKVSREALEEIEVTAREFISLVFPADPNQMAEMKMLIREFRDAFDKRFSVEKCQHTAQLSIQCFFHTTREPL